jgi:hypothetical protein
MKTSKHRMNQRKSVQQRMVTNTFQAIKMLGILLVFGLSLSHPLNCLSQNDYAKWERPVDNPVFTASYGNNHDAVLFVDHTLEYPYHMIVSGWGCGNQRPGNKELAYLWRTKNFSWSGFDWELVSSHYEIGCQYEYDDGVKVNGKYYLYENGIVYTFEGPLEKAAGKWKKEGTFPKNICDDVGVFYENGVFHLFGEYGNFAFGPDGTSLSHLISKTGLGDWKLIDTAAVNPNPKGSSTFGVGDPTIVKIKNDYFIYCDMESDGSPYKIITWKSESLNDKFEYLGVAATARLNETDDWDNYRVQDPDVIYVPELQRYVMVCNMQDRDGNPGGYFPTLKGMTRVIGFFFSK